MGRYLRVTMLFLAPVALLLGAMESALRSIPNDYGFKHEQLLSRGSDLRFIVLGNSHAYHGLEPDSMAPGGFNLANISQDLRYSRAILERYWPGLSALEDVILVVSYGSLGGRLKEGQESWRVKNYAMYMDIDKDATSLKDHFELFQRPMREQVDMLFAYFGSGRDNRNCTASGSGGRQRLPGVDLVSTALKAAGRHHHPDPEEMAHGEADLKAIVDLCTARGVEVHLVTLPATSSYVRALDNAQLEHTRTICKELDLGSPLVDHLDLLEDPRFTEEDFADGDHLSNTGQAKASRIVNAWISRTDR